MQGKSGLLQDRNVPHGVLQAYQPECLETEHGYRGENSLTPPRSQTRAENLERHHYSLIGKKTGLGVKRIRVLIPALLLVSWLERLCSQPLGSAASLKPRESPQGCSLPPLGLPSKQANPPPWYPSPRTVITGYVPASPS